MSTEEYNRYFHMLELTPEASLSEVRNVYNRLKFLYSNDSVELSAISCDFTEEMKQNLLRDIEEAFARLSEFFEGKKDSSVCINGRPELFLDNELKKYIEEVASFSGPVLKQIREMLQVDLEDIVRVTNVRKQFFADIEEERFSSFTAEVYLIGYITEYARFLSLDPARVVNDYLARYRYWKATSSKIKTVK